MQSAWNPGHDTGSVISSSCDSRHSGRLRGSVVHSTDRYRWCLAEESAAADLRSTRVAWRPPGGALLLLLRSADCSRRLYTHSHDVCWCGGASGVDKRDLK